MLVIALCLNGIDLPEKEGKKNPKQNKDEDVEVFLLLCRRHPSVGPSHSPWCQGLIDDGALPWFSLLIGERGIEEFRSSSLFE